MFRSALYPCVIDFIVADTSSSRSSRKAVGQAVGHRSKGDLPRDAMSVNITQTSSDKSAATAGSDNDQKSYKVRVHKAVVLQYYKFWLCIMYCCLHVVEVDILVFRLAWLTKLGALL
jgi:hypothetical protein